MDKINKEMEPKSPLKVLEVKEERKNKKSRESPNPYVRRWGSHIKSHFSQSQCEFFESSGDEKKPTLTINNNNANSLKHLEVGSEGIAADPNAPTASLDLTNTPAQAVHKSSLMVTSEIEMGLPDTDTLKIKSPVTTDHRRKNSLEMELEEMDETEMNDDDDVRSVLMIRSHRSESSEEEIDSDFEGLVEPGAEIIPKFFPVADVDVEDESEKIVVEESESDKGDPSTAGEEGNLESGKEPVEPVESVGPAEKEQGEEVSQ